MKLFLKKAAGGTLAFVMLLFAACLPVFAEETEVEAPLAEEQAVQTTQADEPAEPAAPAPAEEPAPTEEPVEEPAPAEEPAEAPAPAEEPMPAEEPAEASAPEDDPADEPAAPFEQREQIGSALVTVTAPAGVMAPGSSLVIAEAADDALLQAVTAASEAQGDILFHSVIRFSGAGIRGTAQVRITDPRLSELQRQYPGAEMTVSVYVWQPDATRPEEQAKRISAGVNGNDITFSISDMTICDVVIALSLPAPSAEPEAEASTEFTEAPEEVILDEIPEVLAAEDPAGSAEAPEPEAPMSENAREGEDDPFAVTMSASYEGALCDGTEVTLTAVFSADDPDAVIIWEYSPDGGRTVFTAEGEHDRTLVYTYSEETRDYIWRVKVYRAPAA